ncbi:MAG: tyrosine-type recombinase/integrase [Planctomycetota bacterium]
MKPKGRSYYVIRWLDPATGRVRQRATRETRRRAAEAIADQMGQELRGGLKQGEMTWRKFCQRYLAEHMSHNKRTTQREWRTARRHLEAIDCPHLLVDVTASALSRFRAGLVAKGLAPDTVDKNLRTLIAALNWAAAIGLITAAPKLPKLRRQRRAAKRKRMKGRPITLEEFERQVAKAAEAAPAGYAESWEDMCWHGWDSGLRLGELLDLHWTDPTKIRPVELDSDCPLLDIPEELDKSGESRLLPISPEWAARLRAVAAAERNGFVCNPGGPRGGTRDLNEVSRRIKKMGKLAGIVVDHGKPKASGEPGAKKYATAQDWRRAFGERWAARVMPPVLQQLMRHEDIKTTMKFYVGAESRRLAASVWEWEARRVTRSREHLRDHEPESA